MMKNKYLLLISDNHYAMSVDTLLVELGLNFLKPEATIPFDESILLFFSSKKSIEVLHQLLSTRSKLEKYLLLDISHSKISFRMPPNISQAINVFVNGYQSLLSDANYMEEMNLKELEELLNELEISEEYELCAHVAQLIELKKMSNTKEKIEI